MKEREKREGERKKEREDRKRGKKKTPHNTWNNNAKNDYWKDLPNEVLLLAQPSLWLIIKFWGRGGGCSFIKIQFMYHSIHSFKVSDSMGLINFRAF